MEEDRGVLSDVGNKVLWYLQRLTSVSQSDTTRGLVTKGRGNAFGREHSSSIGRPPSSPMSKEATTPRSDITPIEDGVRLRQPRKRSLDTGRETSRLSFFGTTIAGTLGKARKPPPRYSA